MLVRVCCGTSTVVAAVFGPGTRGNHVRGELLPTSLRDGMIMLADRSFASKALVAAIAQTGAHLLIRGNAGRTGRKLPPCTATADPSRTASIVALRPAWASETAN